MQDGQIPKDMLYDVLATGSRPAGRPVLHYKDVCKHNLKASNINPAGWEAVAADRNGWMLAIKAGIQRSKKRRPVGREKRAYMTESRISSP